MTTPSIPLGTYGPPFLERRLNLSLREAKTHFHLIGISGSGKSRALVALFLMLLNRGLSATFIDPHGDGAMLALAYLVAKGAYDKGDAFDRFLYLDLPAAERRGRFLPFNVLRQSTNPHATASNIKEAFHRAWPALGAGAAPMFDTLLQDGVKVLLSNGIPITPHLYRLLTIKGYRDELLIQEQDQDVVHFFHDQFDRLSPHDQADQAGSALRRAHLLTFSPVLKYSLGQRENLLNFRSILDQNRSLIINLALPDAEARRLLGCLLMVTAEQAALSRADLPPDRRLGSHHMVLDEFSEFTAQSEESLSRILSLCRKWGLYLVMAHQTWSQASERLRGALQNCGVEVVFKLGRSDAEHSARVLGRVNPMAIKHEVTNPWQVEKTHPVFYSLLEQWEGWVQAIQDLRPREAFVRRPNGKVAKIKTLSMPDPRVDRGRLQDIEDHYLDTYFRPQSEIEREVNSSIQATIPDTTRIRRINQFDDPESASPLSGKDAGEG